MKGYETQNKCQVIISSLIKRYDQNFNEAIRSINEKLQSFAYAKVCFLLTIEILINHVKIGVSYT